VLLNAGAFTHTSVALRDAVAACRVPVVEVHLSNPAAREPFRRRSYLSDAVVAVVQGFGPDSYLLALRGLLGHLRRAETS
jgi:3-dehydroquinate dehydratase-2